MEEPLLALFLGGVVVVEMISWVSIVCGNIALLVEIVKGAEALGEVGVELVEEVGGEEALGG